MCRAAISREASGFRDTPEALIARIMLERTVVMHWIIERGK